MAAFSWLSCVLRLCCSLLAASVSCPFSALSFPSLPSQVQSSIVPWKGVARVSPPPAVPGPPILLPVWPPVGLSIPRPHSSTGYGSYPPLSSVRRLESFTFYCRIILSRLAQTQRFTTKSSSLVTLTQMLRLSRRIWPSETRFRHSGSGRTVGKIL